MIEDEIGLASEPFLFPAGGILAVQASLIKGGVGVDCLYSLRKRDRFLQGCCI